MPASLIEGDSLLAVDIGPTVTRAALFDVVEGCYRFVATGQAPSTAEAPFKDIGLGLQEAVANIQAVTGRVFLDAEGRLVLPTQADGSGVDAFAASLSAGPSIRTAIVGLLPGVSLESARRLAETAYSRIVERLELTDRRRPEEQIDGLLRAHPDLIVLTGGTDGGASRSVQKMLEAVGLACFLSPPEKRPVILFAGNQQLTEEVKKLVEQLTPALHFTPNVRPSLETEDLDPAMRDLAHLFMVIRKGQVRGVDELEGWSRGHLLPTAYASGRMIRFINRMNNARGGVLGVDVDAAGATVAAGFHSGLDLHVYPQFGLGDSLAAILQQTSLEDIQRWLSLDIPAGAVRDAIYQKSIHPSIIPASVEERDIAQAITRQFLYLALRAARRDFPPAARSLRPELMPFFDLIIAGAGALADAPTPGQGLLLLLDAIQPVGITHFMLDRDNLLPMLGAAAGHNSLLPVQVLESAPFHNVGTTISVVGNAAHGTPILQAAMQYSDGRETRIEVKQGALEALPLAFGETARLSLQPRHRADAGFGPGRGQAVTVNGGALGVVIDARGRPLQLPADAVRRRELFKKWLWTLGG